MRPHRPLLLRTLSPFLVAGVAGLFATVALNAQSLAPVAPQAKAGTKVFEEWGILYLDNKRCGFDSTITTRIDTPTGPTYRTIQQQEFVAKRLGVALKIIDTSNVTEDAEGGVLTFDEVVEGSGSNIVTKGRREGDELIVSSRGQTRHYKMPRLAALGPEAVRRMEDAVPLKPGQIFSLPTFETDYPQATVVEKGTVIGPDVRKIAGVNRQVWKLASSTSLMPALVTTSWVDSQSNDVESILKVPGIGPLDEIVSTRAECMKQPEGAEIFATSLIRPQRAIPSPATLAQAVYRLTSDDTGVELPLWNEGEQRVLSSRPGNSEITVTVPTISPSEVTWRLPHADTPELHPYLQASSYLEVDSPEIQKLGHEAVGGEKNPVLAAHRIENFVRGYIVKKDLNIGFASAEETAKSREGDCTEHAVLCAALGRVVGLPTRCVLGLGYIPPGVDEPTISNKVDKDTGIFGFHMWAEAWVGPGQWVAMDAALDGFDVGHIAITKSALEEVDPLADLNMPILQLTENLRITVLKTFPRKAVIKTARSDMD